VSTTTIKQNIIYGLSEGGSVADATMLTYALRWANAAYREMFLRYRFRCLRTRSIFKSAIGQPTYQAPSDFAGFLVMKDESNDTILDQVTPEELQRESGTLSVTDESFTSSFDVAVQLDHTAIVQFTEVVTNTAGTATYTKDTDYTMDYEDGYITILSTGTMSDATAYYIDYQYKSDDKPNKFAIEYDSTNKRWVFRFDPPPDAAYNFSILYPAMPSDLSGSVEPLWGYLEFAIERGGIYFGSLEIIDDPQKRAEFKQNYETAMQALVQMDQEMIPKQMTIPIRMKKSQHKG
jgi:hypothetical protein